MAVGCERVDGQKRHFSLTTLFVSRYLCPLSVKACHLQEPKLPSTRVRKYNGTEPPARADSSRFIRNITIIVRRIRFAH